MKHKAEFGFPAVACILIIVTVLNAHRSPDAIGAGLITGGIPLQMKQTQYCSAFAPADWTFWNNSTASTAEALSADGTMYSGWAMVTVNPALRPVYGDLYGKPETSIQFMTNRILQGLLGDPSRMRYSSYLRPFLNDFTLSYFESDQNTGLVFYRIYPTGYSDVYTESVYWAIAKKFKGQAGLKAAAGVTVSIRCMAQFWYPAWQRAVPVVIKPGRPGCGTAEALRGYQKELGIQYAHSLRTGQNFLLDPSTQWNETGPAGPGYYQRVDDSHERLQLGRHDDC